MKQLRVKFSNGRTYHIPVDVIAQSRARYYESLGENYVEEVHECLKDNYMIVDWVFNNMDWADVSDEAVLCEEPSLDIEDEEWPNVEHEIV